MFLLTTTAEQVLPAIWFRVIARDEVPASVQASVEFHSACPASAVVMRKRLRAPMTADRTAASSRRPSAPHSCSQQSWDPGIMAERLAAGNEAIALLANTIATGAALVASDSDASVRFRARTSIPR